MAERTHSVRLRLEVDQLRRDAADASRSVGGIGSAAEAAGKQSTALAALGQAGKAVGKTLAAVGTVAVGSMAALGVATIATGISYNTLEQSTRAALTTLLGSAEAATAQMDKLREFVRTALFPREVFIQGQQQLLAFGFAAESVIPTLDAVQNAVAATGGSAQVFTEVVEILAEMQSTGEITAGTLNELGRRGINAAQLIGTAMGKTENEIRDSITSGAIDGRQAIDLLVTAMETRFAGAAELISNTWTGARGLVTAALRDIGSAAVEAFIDPRGGGAAVVWAQNLAEILYALERQIRSTVAVFRESADPALEGFGERLLGVADAIDSFDLQALLDRVRSGAPAFATFGAAAAAAGGQATLSAVGMGSLAGAINPLGVAIAAAVIATPELRDLLMDLLVALQPLLPVVLDTGVALATALSSGLAIVASLLQPLVPLVEAIVDVFTSLPGPVQQAVLALAAFGLALRFAGPVGIALSALAVLGAAVEGLKSAFGDGEVATRQWQSTVAETTTDLKRLAIATRETGDVAQLGDVFRKLGRELSGAQDELSFFERELHSAQGVMDTFDFVPEELTGFGVLIDDVRTTSDVLDEFKGQLTTVDEALGQMVASGDAELAAEAFDRLAGKASLAGVSQAQLMELLPEYARQMQRHEEATADAASGQDGLADSTTAATNAMKEQHDELRAAVDPVFALHQAIREVDAAQEHYNEVLEDSESSQKDVEDAALALADAAFGLQGAVGEASGGFSGRLTPAMRATLEAAGLTEKQIDQVEDSLRDAAEAGRDFEGTYEARAELHGAAAAEAAAKRVQRALANIDRTVTISFKTQGFAPAGSIRIPERWGGVTMHAQQGLLREAATFRPKAPAHFAFAEPATGGEAFIPMRGNRDRSLGILSTAAGWYDAAVVPNESAKPGYVLAEDGSWVPRNFFATTSITKVTLPKPGFVQAEDGSWVPKSFYNAPSAPARKTGMERAAEELLDHIQAGGKFFEDFSFRGMSATLRRFNDELADVFYGSGGAFTMGQVKKFLRAQARQHGGPIVGPPGPDRVPAWLTRGEHVWTAQEVQAAGGHQAVEALRAAVLGHATKFAVGGPVGQPRAAGGDGAAMHTSSTTYQVYPQRADFTIQDLAALTRREDALSRADWPS